MARERRKPGQTIYIALVCLRYFGCDSIKIREVILLSSAALVGLWKILITKQL